MTTYTPTHDEIAAHAYQIYLREGCVEGRDMDHWLKAEAELRAGATNGNGNGNGASSEAARVERTTKPGARKQENILSNSVVPQTRPITQVTTTTPRKSSGKRETTAAR
ncbi:MAG TPA: DUF2934 domain-containing protein [Verrucomicrobiae bacterium]|nr:DUF2934 domain-containing protein [Verrucomicrobiae bacterium]